MTTEFHEGPADHLRIAVAAQDGRKVISPEGELDLSSAPQLERHINEALPGGYTVLDLSGVSFIDSTGIALLVSVSRTARDHGWTLQLRDPSPHVVRLIKLTSVGELLGSPGE